MNGEHRASDRAALPTLHRSATGALKHSTPVGMPCSGPGEHHRRMSAQLVTELRSRARTEGANVGLWPGLTIYRFTRPTQPRWEEIESLSIGIIIQAREALTAVGERRRVRPEQLCGDRQSPAFRLPNRWRRHLTNRLCAWCCKSTRSWSASSQRACATPTLP